jgi:hypothetical protein
MQNANRPYSLVEIPIIAAKLTNAIVSVALARTLHSSYLEHVITARKLATVYDMGWKPLCRLFRSPETGISYFHALQFNGKEGKGLGKGCSVCLFGSQAVSVFAA